MLVDDGSTDDTGKVGESSKVVVLQHRINLGKGAAMKTGALYAFGQGAEAVIFMDSDGQHDVSDLSKFTVALEKAGVDVVLGVRDLKSAPLGRKVGHTLASGIFKAIFGVYIGDLLCGYRAISKRAFGIINWESSRYGVETEMVAKTIRNGIKYVEVPVKTIYFEEVGFDKYKGVSFVQAANILIDVLKWRFFN